MLQLLGEEIGELVDGFVGRTLPVLQLDVGRFAGRFAGNFGAAQCIGLVHHRLEPFRIGVAEERRHIVPRIRLLGYLPKWTNDPVVG